jgi:hypothetical protein
MKRKEKMMLKKTSSSFATAQARIKKRKKGKERKE